MCNGDDCGLQIDFRTAWFQPLGIAVPRERATVNTETLETIDHLAAYDRLANGRGSGPMHGAQVAAAPMFYSTNQKSSVAIFIRKPIPRPDRVLSREPF